MPVALKPISGVLQSGQQFADFQSQVKRCHRNREHRRELNGAQGSVPGRGAARGGRGRSRAESGGVQMERLLEIGHNGPDQMNL